MDIAPLRTRLHTLVDDVVCQGVRYGFEISILRDGRHALGMVRAGALETPLLERLRYVCIVSSNMDEFFEVRFADVIEAASRPGSGVAARDLENIAAAAHRLIDEQYEVFNDAVMPALAAHSIVVLSHAERD